jgi:hypothetical protein
MPSKRMSLPDPSIPAAWKKRFRRKEDGSCAICRGERVEMLPLI